MDRLADRVVAAEREGDVGDAAAHLGVRQRPLDPARGLDEVDRVVVVLLDPGGDREDVRIEDDVLGRESRPPWSADGKRACRSRCVAAACRPGPARRTPSRPRRRRSAAPACAWRRNSASPSFRLIELTTDLPCTHFRPASITLHLLESIMTGTREMSGSEAIRLRNVTIAACESSMASSMFTSMICAPFSTCWRATVQRFGVVAAQDQPRERLRAGDVGALADVHEQRVVADVRAAPARTAAASSRPRAPAAARTVARLRAMARICAGVVPQQPPDDIEEARLRELAQDARHVLGRLVVLAHLVGQTGVRVQRRMRVRDARQLLDVRAQVLRTQRAVQSDRERPRVRHRVPERADGLARQRAARAIGDRAGDHDRQLRAVPLEAVVDREERGLGVERVEDGLDQIRSAPPSTRPRTASE